MGYWFRGQHELLLVGTCGQMPPPPESQRIGSIIREKRSQQHSRKPAVVRKLLESWYPGHRWLELFATEAPEGWTVWPDST